MLGGMVRFVVPPERADLVAGAVVGVEPEVEDDAVEQEFEWEPRADGGEVPGVEVSGHEDEQYRPEDGERGDREEGFGEVGVRDWVAGVLIAVEEADSDCFGVSWRPSCTRTTWHLLRTKIDQHCTFPRHHIEVCPCKQKQSSRERQARSVVESRVGKLHQTGPKSM